MAATRWNIDGYGPPSVAGDHVALPRLTAVALVILAGSVYLNALHNPFAYDDYRMIVDNAAIRSLTNVKAIVMHDVSRPLANVTYAIDYALKGGAPFGFHLTNVFLHMLNVALFFRLAYGLAVDRDRRISRSVSRPDVVAIAASVLLAVHPMMTQAVGYISSRPEALAGTMLLAAFLCARRWMAQGGAGWWAATAGFWVLALTAKEIAIMFPFVLMAYAWLVLDNGSRRVPNPSRLYLPLVAIAIAAAIARLTVLTALEYPGRTSVNWTLGLVELGVVEHYVLLLVFPHGQSVFHAVAPFRGFFHPLTLVTLLLFAAAVALAWRARRIEPLVSFGLAWFLLSLVPSSGLVMLDQAEPMAEHRVYVAAMGAFLIAGAAIERMWLFLPKARLAARIVIKTALVLLLVLFAARTVFRNLIWANPVTLWLEAVNDAPDRWLPHLGLAEALQQRGGCVEALPEYRVTVALGADDPFAFARLGACLVEAGQLAEADTMFRRLQALEPSSPLASIGFGTMAMARGDAPEAQHHLRDALAKDSTNVAARRLLAEVVERDNPEEALRLCREVAELAPQTEGNDECIQRNGARVGAR